MTAVDKSGLSGGQTRALRPVTSPTSLVGTKPFEGVIGTYQPSCLLPPWAVLIFFHWSVSAGVTK